MILQELTIGVALFTGVVLVLALLILLVRWQLIPSGQVTVTVNDTSQFKVPVGSRLLTTLAANGLFLPSACGGSGSCGQCRVKVLQGGGAILAVETSHIKKREAVAGQRLACQVAVDQDIRIRVPDAVFGVKRLQCTVRSNRNVATFIKELVLELPAGETLEFRAGGYILVECPAYRCRFADFDIPDQYREDWQRFGFLALQSSAETPVARAYSLANYPQQNDIAMLNVRIATAPPKLPAGTPPGVVSSYLFSLKQGDSVLISGPFGEFFARETDAEMIFVGGGAGMAPMRSLILDQLKRLNSQRTISFWYGARNLREAFYVDEFDRLARQHKNFQWHLALSQPLPEDNWSGFTGFIHDVLLENYLNSHPAPEDCEYYLCGPAMMYSALSGILYELGVEEENILFDDFG